MPSLGPHFGITLLCSLSDSTFWGHAISWMREKGVSVFSFPATWADALGLQGLKARGNVTCQRPQWEASGGAGDQTQVFRSKILGTILTCYSLCNPAQLIRNNNCFLKYGRKINVVSKGFDRFFSMEDCKPNMNSQAL